VRRRFGLRERTTIALLLLALVLLAVLVVLVRPRVDNVSQVVYRGDPAFTMEYDNRALDSVEPEAGELVRLEGERGRQSALITVRPLEVPPGGGDVAHGVLPTLASGHIRDLAEELDRFELRAQHRARVQRAPGYEVRFRTGPPGRQAFGIDIMLLPDEEQTDGALLLSMRREVEGPFKLTKPERRFADRASEAFRSLRYGTLPD
jgi:hypothetical protein